MQEAAPSPAKDAVQSAEHGETPRLLSVLQLREDLPEGYASLLNRLVFCHEPPDHDQKSIQNLRRILATPEAYRAMFAIWSDALWSLPPKSLNALARRLARDPDERQAMYQRVRNIRTAATAYGLVACSKRHRTRSQLAPTRRLDEFMRKLASQDLAALSKLNVAPLQSAGVSEQ